MPFPRQVAATPIAICEVVIHLISPDPVGGEPLGATYNVQVRFSDGTIRVMNGDMWSLFTGPQATQITAFLAAMRTKAVAEFLP